MAMQAAEDKAKWLGKLFGDDNGTDENFWRDEAAFLSAVDSGTPVRSGSLRSLGSQTSRSSRKMIKRRPPKGNQTSRMMRPRPPGGRTGRRAGGKQPLNYPMVESSRSSHDSLDRFMGDGSLPIIRSATAPSKPPASRRKPNRSDTAVNSLLRDKVTQSLDAMKHLELELKAVQSRMAYVNECTSDLKKLLNQTLAPALALAQARITIRTTLPNLTLHSDKPIDPETAPHAHTQLAIFVSKHDKGGADLESALQSECQHIVASIEQVQGFLEYAGKLSSQMLQVETQLQNYTAYSRYTYRTDHECLRLSEQVDKDEATIQKLPPPPVRVEELLPLAQVIEISNWSVQTSQSYIANSRACLATELKKVKNLEMGTKLALRANLRESLNLKREMQEACMLLRNQLPQLAKQELNMKTQLAAQLKPLEVCQRRYQFRVQREGATELDDVQEVLKQELAVLGETVQAMQGRLYEIQQAAVTTNEREALLNKYLQVQNAHLKLHKKLVGMRVSPSRSPPKAAVAVA